MLKDSSNQPISTSIFEIDAELVEHQLTKIFASKHFKSAKKMQIFLQYIVRKTLAGKSNKLKQYTIAVEALGYPVDFDSDENPVVRIMAGRVRERLEKYYRNGGENDAVVIDIPKGSYAPIFEKKARIVMPEVDKGGNSIPPKLAVLCYSDETQDKEVNRLLFQITDTMAMEFSHFLFTRLVVSIPHADKKRSKFASLEIKERYQADYMLAFYIQQMPQKCKLLVRLMDVSDETVLWSNSYELEDEELFENQHKIIANITTIVADLVQGIVHQHWARNLLKNESTIPVYNKSQVYYRNFHDDLSLVTFRKATKVCTDFLEKKPDDVISLVIYADYCRRDYVYGYNVIESSLNKGKECAQRAVRLQPGSHEAHYVLAQILFCTNEQQECLEELKKIPKIYKYHASVMYGVGLHYCLLGDCAKGLKMVTDVIGISSNYPGWYNLVPFLSAYLKEDYEEALFYANKIDAPNIFHAPMARCVCYAQLGDTDNAKKELNSLLRRFPDFMKVGRPIVERFFGSKNDLAEKLWGGLVEAED